VAAWRDNLARVESPRARPRPARPRPQTRPRPAKRPALLSGVVWIVVLAALLGGIVALNVAVLQLNVRLDELAREKAELRATNTAIASQLSSAGSAPQIERLAQRKLGLVPAADPTYVRLQAGD
jgi:cell division protein FtsB